MIITLNFIILFVLANLIPLILLFIALFILPKTGRPGQIIAIIIVVGVIIWYIGIPTIISPLGGLLG